MKVSKVLKRLHRKAVLGNRFISLKQFVRELAKEGNEEDKLNVDRWKLNKTPMQRNIDKEDRQKRKGAVLSQIRTATHTAKRKRSQGGDKGGKQPTNG